MKKKAFIPLLCFPTFLHLRRRPKVHCFWSAIRRIIRFFTCCSKLAIQAGQIFNLILEENRSLLFTMAAWICFKMLMKSFVYHFPSTEFSIWKSIEIDKHCWFYFITIFLNNNQIAKLKVHLKLVLNRISSGTTAGCTQSDPDGPICHHCSHRGRCLSTIQAILYITKGKNYSLGYWDGLPSVFRGSMFSGICLYFSFDLLQQQWSDLNRQGSWCIEDQHSQISPLDYVLFFCYFLGIRWLIQNRHANIHQKDQNGYDSIGRSLKAFEEICDKYDQFLEYCGLMIDANTKYKKAKFTNDFKRMVHMLYWIKSCTGGLLDFYAYLLVQRNKNGFEFYQGLLEWLLSWINSKAA